MCVGGGGHSSISDTHLPVFCVYLSNWFLILSSLSTCFQGDRPKVALLCFPFFTLCKCFVLSAHLPRHIIPIIHMNKQSGEIILLCSSGDGAQALRHAKKGLYSSRQLLKRRSRIELMLQLRALWAEDRIFLF